MNNHTLLLVNAAPKSTNRWNGFFNGGELSIIKKNGFELSSTEFDATDIDLIIVEASGQSQTDNNLCSDLILAYSVPILLVMPGKNEEHAIAAYRLGVDECIYGDTGSELIHAKVTAWLRWLSRNEAPLPCQPQSHAMELDQHAFSYQITDETPMLIS